MISIYQMFCVQSVIKIIKFLQIDYLCYKVKSNASNSTCVLLQQCPGVPLKRSRRAYSLIMAPFFEGQLHNPLTVPPVFLQATIFGFDSSNLDRTLPTLLLLKYYKNPLFLLVYVLNIFNLRLVFANIVRQIIKKIYLKLIKEITIEIIDKITFYVSKCHLYVIIHAQFKKPFCIYF